MEGAGADVPPSTESRDAVLDPRPAYFVEVCGFTFEFWSIEQIKVALAFFEKRIHPSSRFSKEWNPWGLTPQQMAHGTPRSKWFPSFMETHRHECQRWYERLPQYLQERGKREKVVKALRRAAAMYGSR